MKSLCLMCRMYLLAQPARIQHVTSVKLLDRTKPNIFTSVQLLDRTKLNLARQYSTNVHHKQTYYSVLGLKNTATSKDIRDAFIKLSKENHPDTNPNNPSLHRKFAQINEAYSVLKSRKSDKPGKDGKRTGGVYQTGDNDPKEGYEDWVEFQHFQYMNSREYAQYARQKMQEAQQDAIHRAKAAENDRKFQKKTAMGIIIAIAIPVGGSFLFNYFKGFQDDRSDEIRERHRAYFRQIYQEQDPRFHRRQAKPVKQEANTSGSSSLVDVKSSDKQLVTSVN